MVKTSDLVLQKFNLFPNPNNGEFSLELEIPEGGYYDFKVYNSTGILVLSDKKKWQQDLILWISY